LSSDWDWAWAWDWGLGMGMGNGNGKMGMGKWKWENGNGKMGNREYPPVPGDDSIMPGATTTTTTTHPQLLTMKEKCDNKVPLVKMSQDDPLNSSSITR